MARVLVVDDDEIVRSLLQAHLTQAGHRVLVSPSADDAMAAVEEKGAPDVAVLDVRLPDMYGFDLARKLRAVPGCEALPVIFLSANVDQQHIEEGRDLGAAYLTKPYVRNALCAAVDKAVRTNEEW